MLGYVFDRGILTFGRHVDNEVDKAGKRASEGARQRRTKGAAKAAQVMENAARKRKLLQLLGDDPTNKPGMYADPLKRSGVKINREFSHG